MNIIDKIKNNELIQEIKSIFSEDEIYIVGGYIRDLYFGKESADKDLVCMNLSSEYVADKIEKYFSGTKILLDKENKIYRVVLSDKINYFDITETDNIEMDSIRRDFTINSIYYNIKTNSIYDIQNGEEDITKNKIIRTTDTKNLSEDPLRMLRAFRFSSIYNFKIEENIINFVKENHTLIQNVSFERINYEILKIFSGKNLIDNLRLMNETGMFKEIFPYTSRINEVPKNSHHHLPLFEHTLETIKYFQNTDNPYIKLGAMMHDIGKPQTWKIDSDGRHRFIGHDIEGEKLAKSELKKLKFSNKQIEYISQLVRYHIYPALLMQNQTVTEKAIYRFYKKTKEIYKDLIELAKADRFATRGEAISEDDIKISINNLDKLLIFCNKLNSKAEKLPKIISGYEIMEILDIKPSKKIGELLNEIEELRIIGKINTKEEAINYIKDRNII